VYRRIAKALLESVFYRVSAIISLDENEKILSVTLFSTDWPEGHLCIDENAREIWLISNHPDGSMQPDDQDCHNFHLIERLACGILVRFFLASEYFSCFRAEISQSLRM